MHSIKKDLQIQIFYQITIHKILHNTCISNQPIRIIKIYRWKKSCVEKDSRRIVSVIVVVVAVVVGPGLSQIYRDVSCPPQLPRSLCPITPILYYAATP